MSVCECGSLCVFECFCVRVCVYVCECGCENVCVWERKCVCVRETERLCVCVCVCVCVLRTLKIYFLSNFHIGIFKKKYEKQRDCKIIFNCIKPQVIQ